MHGSKAKQPLESPEAVEIRRAQHGNASAFEQLYRRHSGRVYALCMRMLRNPEEAEDATQEVFLQVFRKIHGFRGDSAFSTWLHRVTVNIVLMRLRRNRPVQQPFADDTRQGEEMGSGRSELGEPDPRLEGYVDRVTLEKAIGQLPPGCRLMFVLYDIQGYAHREIAKIVGCSVGNAKSQLHKARTRLRKLLNQNQAIRERETSPVASRPSAGGACFLGQRQAYQSS